MPVEKEGGLDPAIASMIWTVRKLRTPPRNALQCPKTGDSSAAGKVDFELLHLNVAPAQPDFLCASTSQVMWRVLECNDASLRASRGKRHINLCAT